MCPHWGGKTPTGKGGGGAYIDTMIYRLADRLLLLKCYDKKWSSYRGVPL